MKTAEPEAAGAELCHSDCRKPGGQHKNWNGIYTTF